MQQLHLVGFTTDLDQLILSTRKGAKSGSFLVPFDERLVEEIAEALRRRNDAAGTGSAAPPIKVPAELVKVAEPSRRSSRLSPREIQARLRAGRSVADVATEASAEEDWVAKFEPPVVAERGRVVDTVRRLVFEKPRRGESAEPLGVSVRWNLADRGVRLTDDEFDACWTASLVADTTWAIAFDYVSRGRRQHAEWEVDLHEGEVMARNRMASDLGYVESGRRRRPIVAAAPAPRKATAAAAGAGAGKASSKRGGSAAAAKRSSARTKKAATPAKRSAAQVRSRSRSEGPPAPAMSPVVAARPPVDELTKRRLELVRNAARDAEPPARGRLAERVQLRDRSLTRAAPSPAPRAPSAVESEPEPEPEPYVEPTVSSTEAELEELIRRRREERRQARAAARQAPSPPPQAARPGLPPARAEPAEREPAPPAVEERVERTEDEARVVTIRANRAEAGGGGDVVLPAGRRPLRPALPVTQPRRRRFGRGGR